MQHVLHLASTAKLLCLVTLFQKTYLELNGDYFLSCGLLHYTMRCTEKAFKLRKVKVTLRRLRLRLKQNKSVLIQLESFAHFCVFVTFQKITNISVCFTCWTIPLIFFPPNPLEYQNTRKSNNGYSLNTK